MNTTNELFGAHYFDIKKSSVYESSTDQLYFFRTYIGQHNLEIEKGDCVYYFNDELDSAIVKNGSARISSRYLATVIRGYMHPDATCSLEGVTTLPYINGCSTKQIFPPIRLGDPTLQYLKVPPYSKEQKHHIHSTFRVVLILKGIGTSVVGVEEKNITTDLKFGTVCILEPMSPHHFETHTDESLVAVPLHIFSSVGVAEKNHPMFNGTIGI